MRKLILAGILATSVFYAHATEKCEVKGSCGWTAVKPEQTKTDTTHSTNGIDATELKKLVDDKSAVILDARPGKYFDGNLIPGAKNIPYDAPEAELTAAIPSKGALVVTYCTNTQCPASKWLAERLTKLGYTNVKEYHGGIADWMAAGYNVDTKAK